VLPVPKSKSKHKKKSLLCGWEPNSERDLFIFVNLHFLKLRALDAKIKEKFGILVEKAIAGELGEFFA
jgi:hypothetical protein